MTARRLIPLLALLIAACGGSPPRETRISAAETPEEIVERFLEAREGGNAKEVWSCFAGGTEQKRIYRFHRAGVRGLTWAEFVRDLGMKWATPALAPATVREKVGERTEDGLRIFTFRQGTSDRPDRGLIEVAACPVGTGWLVAWVGVKP